jgi:hypothetical protein
MLLVLTPVFCYLLFRFGIFRFGVPSIRSTFRSVLRKTTLVYLFLEDRQKNH